MTIIHKVSEFLGELFPRYKESGYNENVLKEELTQYYTFSIYRPIIEIKDGFVTVTIDTHRIASEVDEYKAVVRLCEQGQYENAKPRLQTLIQQNPTNSEYHRILGQIYSDEGDQELAVDSLIDALRWNPKNTYGLTMMGNILAKHRNDIDSAMKYYNQVIEINPEDVIAINNLGANLLQQGKISEAKQYFLKARDINPDYPNTHYAIALVEEMEENLNESFQEGLIALKKSTAKDDIYKQSYSLLIKTGKKLIETDSGFNILKSFLHKLEFEGDRKIDIIEDDTIETIAKMELAENYNRDHHLIRYKPSYPAKEHLMMHELVHIKYVIDARKENQNQLFLTIQKHKSDFFTKHEHWIKKMVKMGISEESISKVIGDLFQGLNRQVYNVPIDLFIEEYLFITYPGLRPYQFLSLFNIIKEGIDATTRKGIVELVPKDILHHSKIYNLITALQYKDLYGVDLIKEFHPEPSELKTAQNLFSEYLEYKDDRQPGEEYELVENWAKDLKLEDNFQLVGEKEFNDKKSNVADILKSIEDDPFDLKGNQSTKQRDHDKFLKTQSGLGFNNAVMWYMVEALQYFDKLTPVDIKKVAVEIAFLGTHGIKPDGSGYKLTNVPEKEFSGYHLLAFYYVSWALTDPEFLGKLDLPYQSEYEMAKTIFTPEG